MNFLPWLLTYMGLQTRFWCLSHQRAAKAQTSLHMLAVWSEPSLLAYTKYGSRGKPRQQIRPLALLDISAVSRLRIWDRYWKFRNFRENFIFTNSVKRHICHTNNPQLAWFTYISKGQRIFSISWGLYFSETSHTRSFAEIKPSRKFLNLQYQNLVCWLHTMFIGFDGKHCHLHVYI